jgi:hypothetical protein
MDNVEKGGCIIGAGAMALVLAAGAGWVMNIMAIINMGEFSWSGEVVIRCLGVLVFPIGCIAGWC